MKKQSINRLVLIFLLVGLFFLFFLPPSDPDLGWQEVFRDKGKVVYKKL